MASLVARSGALPCLAQKAKATRVGRRPAPFTPARRVFARAAAPEAVEEDVVLDEYDVQELMEENIYGVENDDIKLTDEDYDILDEADEFINDLAAIPVDVAAAVAAEMVGEEEEDVDEEGQHVSGKARAAAVAETLLLSKLESAYADAITEGDLEDLETVGADAEVVEALEVAPPSGADKYMDAPLSPAEKEAVASYKLSKGELRNLLPKDWDQINIDFFSNKKKENIPLPEFKLNVLWTSSNVAVAIDQVYSRGQVSPLTEYFFWPRNDAWEECKTALEGRPWINERDKIVLLNRLTQIINFWQDETVKRTVEEARLEFPDCTFMSG